MKKCGTCGVEKAFEQFHRLARSVDGLQSVCKACKSQYSKERYREGYASYGEARQAKDRELREWARGLKEGPCADCGGTFHFRAMHWDHTGDDKFADVSLMVSRRFGRERILAEIAKCDLVCANCHAVRTWSREQAAVG